MAQYSFCRFITLSWRFYKSLKSILYKLKTTGFFHIFGSSVFAKIIGFLSSIVLVRLVSKPGYGVFTYAWNIYSIAILFSGCGMSSGVLQVASENSDNVLKKSTIYTYGMRAGTMVNIVLCVVLLVIGINYPFQIKGTNLLLCLLSVLPIVEYWNDYQITYLRVERRTKAYAVLNATNVMLVFLLSVVGALLIQEKGFIVSRYITFSTLVFLGYRFCKVPLFWKKKPIQKQDKKDLWKIATVSMVNTGISQMLYLLDVLVLGVVIPDSSVVASYKVATVIPTALSFIPSALITYVYPYFAQNRKNSEWCIQKYKLILIGMGGLNLAISTVLVFFAPSIIKLIYGTQYLDAVQPFRILSFSYFFSGTFRVIAGNLLVTQRKLGYNSFVAIISGIMNIFADVILIRMMGSVGAAWATLVIVIFTSVLNVVYLFYSFSHVKK